MFGVKLNVKEYFAIGESGSDEGERLYDISFPWCGKGAKGKIGVLADGMGGKYVVAGRCLAVQNEEGDEDFGCLELQKHFRADQGENLQIWEFLVQHELMHLVPEGEEYQLFLISHFH
jgi:hypothetical protein